MRDYGKVYSNFWSSERMADLSDDAKLLALYLMSCSHGTIAGVFRLPDGYIAEDLGERWSAERLSQGLAELSAKNFAHRCATSKWVWIVKHLDLNKPENPNQRKAAVKVAMSVPESCSWRPEFLRQCSPKLEIPARPPVPAPDENGFDNPSRTLSEGFPQKQKQEQEQDQDQKLQGAYAPLSPDKRATVTGGNVLTLETPVSAIPPCPVKQLVAVFAAKVPELPRPRVELFAGNAGGEAMRQRWKWILTARREDGTRYATNQAEALDWFGRFFDTVAESDFLTGRNGRWQSCGLAWLMKKENFAKVVDGQYSSERKAA